VSYICDRCGATQWRGNTTPGMFKHYACGGEFVDPNGRQHQPGTIDGTQYCLHSMPIKGCYSCLVGEHERQEAHIARLRGMLIAAGEAWALSEHDNKWFGRKYGT
jgi:hypothetical protein